MTKPENRRMIPLLEKVFIGFVTVGISAIVAMQWQMNSLIAVHDSRLTRIEAAMTVLEAQMVGWEVLKRMELNMIAMGPKAASLALTKALSAEIAGREERMKK